MLEAAAEISPEQFDRKILPGFGSLHLTLVHILGAEAIWLARWKGDSPRAMFLADDLPGVTAIRARWEALDDERAGSRAR